MTTPARRTGHPHRCQTCSLITSDTTTTPCCNVAMCPKCAAKHGSCEEEK